MQVLSPESLAIYPETASAPTAPTPTRTPGAYNSLASGLPVFSASACANSAPSVSGPPNEIDLRRTHHNS